MPVLTYFPSRGLAELVRVLLSVAGVAYEQRFVGDRAPELLPALKASGVLAFGAVPLWEDGSLSLVQSDAILRHLARAHGLYGATASDAARCDEQHEGVRDVRAQLGRLRGAAPADVAGLRAELADAVLPRWLGHFERRLTGRTWLVGDAVTYADLSLWLLLETLRDNGLASGLAACPALTAHEARVAALPGVAAHVADPNRFPVQPLPR